MKRRFFQRLVITVVVFSVPVLAFAYYIFLLPNYYNDPKGKVVTIPRGASFRSAVDSLVVRGLFEIIGHFKLQVVCWVTRKQ